MASARSSQALRHVLSFSQYQSLHTSASRRAVTPFRMPAMSPTMTEGGIASWKKKEGDSYTAGDVLLEIETDKATMDVEAQEDGVLGKIVMGDGSKNVQVGKIIAMTAEEGDDISDIKIPAEDTSSSSEPKEDAKTKQTAESTSAESSKSGSSTKSAPSSGSSTKDDSPSNKESHAHVRIESSRPLFPSVARLLQEAGISDISQIKGTGVRGMLRKGDVLAHLGRASSPWGTSQDPKDTPSVHAVSTEASSPPKAEEKPLDAPAVRDIIISRLARATAARTPQTPQATSFEDIIRDYDPSIGLPKTTLPPPAPKAPSSSYLDGLI